MESSLDYTRTMRIDIPPLAATKSGDTLLSQDARIERLKIGRDKFHASNPPYNRLLASIYDGVLITSRDGVIMDYNGRVLEYLLFKPEQLLGRSVIDVISGADDNLLREVAHNLKEYRYTIVEAYCSRADGSNFPAEIAITSIMSGNDGYLGVFIRDISVRVRAQQELRNAVERLEALDRARLEFVSNVSHELRTPLTSMIYAVKNMLRGVAGPLPEKALQYLERLHADCRRLQGTVNDILDIQQIENDQLTLTPSRVPLARLVEVGVDSLRVQAEEKHIRLLFCRPNVMTFADCDINKMERVVLNIVGNAIKFTPEDGHITVSVERLEGGKEVALIVRDSGVGIPSEALSRITVRYFKVGDQPIGSGLGLAISRELVELHGGRVTIESPVPGTDKGTQVKVVLPSVEPPSVMLATAREGIIAQVEAICGWMGLPLTVVKSSDELMSHCGKGCPGALIVDFDLPKEGGMDAAIYARNSRNTARVPILLLVEGGVTRAHNEMIKALKIPVLALPMVDQALVMALNQMFYDYMLGATVPSPTMAATTVVSPSS